RTCRSRGSSSSHRGSPPAQVRAWWQGRRRSCRFVRISWLLMPPHFCFSTKHIRFHGKYSHFSWLFLFSIGKCVRMSRTLSVIFAIFVRNGKIHSTCRYPFVLSVYVKIAKIATAFS